MTAFPKPEKRPPRSVRAVGLGAMEDQADALWARAVKRRDRERCVRCQSRVGLEAHHGISRRYRATRWLVEIGVTLCWDCHYAWAHKFPEESRAWFEKRIGSNRYGELIQVARSRPDVDLKTVVAGLKRAA